MRKQLRLLAWTLCAAVMASSMPLAAANKDPNKEALRRLQIQVKQAEDAKAAVQAEKSALEQELAALRKKAGGLESAAARNGARSTKLEKELEATRSELSAKLEMAGQQLADSQASLKSTRADLLRVQTERQQLEAALASRTSAAQRCEANNRKLYQYHVELINHAQSQGSFSALLAVEPVTQIGRVEIENILEAYRDKIDAAQAGSAPAENVQQ